MADFNWYRNFLAVYRMGSVSGAARARNVTQPTLSQQLAALEASLGEALFVRTARGMEPTERGKALYAEVADAIDRLEQVNRSRKTNVSLELPLLRLGTTPEFFQVYLLPHLKTLNLRMHVKFADPKTLHEELETGNLDLVVSTRRPTGRVLEGQILSRKHIVLVAPASFPLPEHEALETWLPAQHWVAHNTDILLIRKFWKDFYSSRLDIQPLLVVPDLRMVLSAVEQGLGLAVLPEFLCLEALQTGRVQRVLGPIELYSREQWIMAYREADRQKDTLRQVMDCLTTVLEAAGD
ncbi:LysR family transcriptional regulator [Deinococcus roseus]|uniref:LysR family transcriptional regulator n=1 Tax=Deinococcus roseus TaxID=392414 RepID=A0ABQ2D1R8_9DEIO|nr:LysR family transcriptional regulator [Deinococcus roseus]GGJ40948.1 LysR family transcriptional regulator [Deinococcus roseus]